MSAQLVPAHGGKRVVPEVNSDPQTEGGHIGSVGADPNSRKDEPVSDHAPVTAQFAF